jgi:hypothetical protein
LLIKGDCGISAKEDFPLTGERRKLLNLGLLHGLFIAALRGFLEDPGAIVARFGREGSKT